MAVFFKIEGVNTSEIKIESAKARRPGLHTFKENQMEGTPSFLQVGQKVLDNVDCMQQLESLCKIKSVS